MTVYGLTRAGTRSSRHRGSPGRNDLQALRGRATARAGHARRAARHVRPERGRSAPDGRPLAAPPRAGRQRAGGDEARPAGPDCQGQGRRAERVGHAQLAYIAEIAERLGKGEDVLLVVADFWGRGIKDHRGLPWGQVQAKPGKGTGNGFEWFRRARRWFHRMKHAGKLPPRARA